MIQDLEPNRDAAAEARERRLRALARQQGRRLWRVPADNRRQFSTFGPYAVIDLESKAVAPYGLTLDDAEVWLTGPGAAG